MGAVTLLVGDLDGMTAFYRDVITLQVLSAEGDEVVLGRAGRPVVVLRHEPALRHASAGAAGLFHTAILFETQEALAAALYSVAQRAPHTFTGSADHLVSQAFYLTDPEGNGIEIYADRMPTEWKRDGDQIAMATQRMDIAGVRGSVPAGDAGWQGAPENSVVGHVHLRVGDPAAAEDWWHRTLGFDTMAKYGAQAVFLSTGGYHHHVGANTWQSTGAGQRDKGRSGLAWVELLSSDAKARASYEDPWGTEIRVVPGKPA